MRTKNPGFPQPRPDRANAAKVRADSPRVFRARTILRRAIHAFEAACSGEANADASRNNSIRLSLGDAREVQQDLLRIRKMGVRATWARHIADAWQVAGTTGRPVIFVHLASSPVTAMFHLLSRIGRLPMTGMAAGKLDEARFQRLIAAVPAIRDSGLGFADLRPIPCPQQAVEMIRAQHPGTVLVIDTDIPGFRRTNADIPFRFP